MEDFDFAPLLAAGKTHDEILAAARAFYAAQVEKMAVEQVCIRESKRAK